MDLDLLVERTTFQGYGENASIILRICMNERNGYSDMVSGFPCLIFLFKLALRPS